MTSLSETADLRGRFGEVQVVYMAAGGNIALRLVAENMLDNLFDERLEKDDLLSIEKDG